MKVDAFSSDVYKKTAEHWGQGEDWSDERGIAWTELAPVRQRLELKVTGGGYRDWIEYTTGEYWADRLPLQRCLVLCCGRGGLERSLACRNIFVECDAVDISEESIRMARERAIREGHTNINYSVGDVNTISITTNHYDAVWCTAALHHIEKLEHVCAEVSKGLKPNGLFVLYEYVGPSRFQFSERRKQIIQACFELLPERYRRPVPKLLQQEVARNPFRMGCRWTAQRVVDKMREGTLLQAIRNRCRAIIASRSGRVAAKEVVDLPTVSSVVANDPSEAVRSADILSVLAQYFDIIDLKELGGGLLQFLLHGIAGNFVPGDPKDMAWLQFLFNIEDAMMEMGEVESDFAYIAARPKGGATSP